MLEQENELAETKEKFIELSREHNNLKEEIQVHHEKSMNTTACSTKNIEKQ
jgi:hypothetical protein